MKLSEARAIVDAGHIVACQYGSRDDECAFVEIETGETDYAAHLGGGRGSVACETWEEVERALGEAARSDQWDRMTEDQEEDA